MSHTSENTKQILEPLGLQDNPGGSLAQVALLSARIDALQKHLEANKKDKHSRRGLLQMVADRRRHVRYLRRTDSEGYARLASQLGLKA